MLPAENLNNSIKNFWPKNGPSILEVEKYVKKYSKVKIPKLKKNISRREFISLKIFEFKNA